MSAGKHRRRRDASVDDNAIDPSEFFDPHHNARGERKVQQLCKEVERTLGYALPSCGDPKLRELVIVSVDPAPDGSRLLVTVSPSSSLEINVGTLMERIQRVRGLLRAEIAAALHRKRTPALADIPTIAELGIPGFDMASMLGALVPAGTPRDIVAKLNAGVVAAVASPEVNDKIAGFGVRIGTSTPEQFDALMRAEYDKYARLVKLSGAKLD